MEKIRALIAYIRENPVVTVVVVAVSGGMLTVSVAFFNFRPIQFVERLFWPALFVEGSTGSGGNWHTTHFTDPPQSYDPNSFRGEIPDDLIALINAAESSIDVAAFDFDVTPIAEALIAAHDRGVDVRWFTDDEHGQGDDDEPGGGQFRMLREAGIPVRDDNREPLMHNKFIVFDEALVWTGSTNLTQNGLFRNNNNVIIFDSPDIASFYRREFNELWRGNSGAESRSTIRFQTAVLEGTPVLIIFGPEDDGIEHLVQLVRQAQESVHFMAFSFTHDDLGEALVERARRGVEVRGVFEQRNINSEFSEHHRLACDGMDVRIDGNSGSMHHKVFIIDGTIVVTGSFNFSNNADRSNDENMVFLNHTGIGADYDREFQRVWGESRLPEPGEVVCP